MNNEYKEWHKQLLKEKAEMLEEIRTAKDEAVREVYKLKKFVHTDIYPLLGALTFQDSNIKCNDWNENNPNAWGYIKNRPFYSGTAEKVLADNVTVVSEWGTGFIEASEPISIPSGSVVECTFNGETFEAEWTDGFAVPNTDVGFVAYEGSDGIYVNSNEYTDSRTDVITIKVKVEEVHKLDEKYIPQKDILFTKEYGEDPVPLSSLTVQTASDGLTGLKIDDDNTIYFQRASNSSEANCFSVATTEEILALEVGSSATMDGEAYKGKFSTHKLCTGTVTYNRKVKGLFIFPGSNTVDGIFFCTADTFKVFKVNFAINSYIFTFTRIL